MSTCVDAMVDVVGYHFDGAATAALQLFTKEEINRGKRKLSSIFLHFTLEPRP